MKKAFVLSIALFTAFSIQGQDLKLNKNVEYIITYHEDAYNKIFLYHADRIWWSDYAMMIVWINEQVDAAMYIKQNYRRNHGKILYKAIQKWSYPGYKEYNKKIWDPNKMPYSSTIYFKLHCDWANVKKDCEDLIK